MSYIYLIQSVEYFKIGIANDLESRLAQLQTGNPNELVIESCYEFSNAQAIETVLHQKFNSVRKHGEWFRLSNQNLREFDTICEMLGGVRYSPNSEISTEDAVEEADEIGDYLPTLEDAKRIMLDPNYRIEYRYNSNGLRGFAWRLRTGDKECPLYIGKRNPIFDDVKSLLSAVTSTEAK